MRSILRQWQQDGSFEVLSFGEYLQVFARQRYWLFDAGAVFVAQHLQFGVEAGADAAALQADVDAAGPVLRDCEIKRAGLPASWKHSSRVRERGGASEAGMSSIRPSGKTPEAWLMLSWPSLRPVRRSAATRIPSCGRRELGEEAERLLKETVLRLQMLRR